jgi:hypothetical protein
MEFSNLGRVVRAPPCNFEQIVGLPLLAVGPQHDPAHWAAARLDLLRQSGHRGIRIEYLAARQGEPDLRSRIAKVDRRVGEIQRHRYLQIDPAPQLDPRYSGAPTPAVELEQLAERAPREGLHVCWPV